MEEVISFVEDHNVHQLCIIDLIAFYGDADDQMHPIDAVGHVASKKQVT